MELFFQLVGCPVKLFFTPGLNYTVLFLLSMLQLQLLRFLALLFGPLGHLPLDLASLFCGGYRRFLFKLLLLDHSLVLARLCLRVFDDDIELV